MEREYIDAPIKHMYASDLRSGWGIHVVQEVKMLAKKATMKVYEIYASPNEPNCDVSLANLTGSEAKIVDISVVLQDENLIKEVICKPKEVGYGDNGENLKSRSNKHAKLATEVLIYVKSRSNEHAKLSTKIVKLAFFHITLNVTSAQLLVTTESLFDYGALKVDYEEVSFTGVGCYLCVAPGSKGIL
ncbi:hypothetical protein M8C21_002015, partial [Ambrosia artemisiifolia]